MTGPRDPSPEAVGARIRRAGALASFRPERRLDAKVGLGPADLTRRLRAASALRAACARLARLGAAGPPAS